MMILKKDNGVTEVVGFAFVLIILIFGVVMWLLIAMPIYGNNDELQHNTAVTFEMSELKKDIDTMCLSNALGIKRQKIINLAPTSDKSKITVLPDFKTLQSYGSISLKNIYGYLAIVYMSSNTYADDITVVYCNGALYSYEGSTFDISKITNPSQLGTPYLYSIGYNILVDGSFEEKTIGSNEAVVIDYSIIDVGGTSPNKYYVLSIGMA